MTPKTGTRRALRTISHLALTAAIAGLLAASAQAAGPETQGSHAAGAMDMSTASTGLVEWDAQSSLELKQALHHMHETWNSGDIVRLKELMQGDDVLVSFELDPKTHEPIRLMSKQAIDDFVIATAQSIDDAGMRTKLEMPSLNCRATKTFGVCTEECTVNFLDKDSDEVVATDRLWSTAVAVKHEDGWRWIQWHMSVGGPVESVAARANLPATD